MSSEMVRSGFVCIAGRPNVGKSTFLNKLLGTKVAIATNKPQTTRTAIRGILDSQDSQIVFIDTPGLHKPKSRMGRRMNDVARRTLQETDIVLVMLDASGEIGAGDKWIATEVAAAKTPALCVINKADRVDPQRLLEQIEAAAKLGEWIDVLTTSSTRGTGLDWVVKTLTANLPDGPRFYPQGTVTDQPEDVIISELVREKVLELTREEVPYSVAVLVDEIAKREDSDLIDVYASIYVERDSQKGILIGRGGKMLKEIGTRARVEIEALVGAKIYLDLRIKVESEWQSDDRSLDKFGY